MTDETVRPLQRLVVLISGGGSNLQAILDACAEGRIAGVIVAVISNRADAGGLARAQALGIATEVLSHRDWPDRASYDAALSQAIDRYQPNWVLLAGFMRILTTGFVHHYHGRLINIHPSLLPRHPGLHTHQRALDEGDEQHGATVHFVTEQLDGGPLILQARVPVLPNDDADTLARRVLEQEHVIYPQVVQWLCDQRLQLNAEDAVVLDGNILPDTGMLWN